MLVQPELQQDEQVLYEIPTSDQVKKEYLRFSIYLLAIVAVCGLVKGHYAFLAGELNFDVLSPATYDIFTALIIAVFFLVAFGIALLLQYKLVGYMSKRRKLIFTNKRIISVKGRRIRTLDRRYIGFKNVSVLIKRKFIILKRIDFDYNGPVSIFTIMFFPDMQAIAAHRGPLSLMERIKCRAPLIFYDIDLTWLPKIKEYCLASSDERNIDHSSNK